MKPDICMSKAQYRLGEPIDVRITARDGADIQVTIQHLAEEPIPYHEGMIPPVTGGYGVCATVDGLRLSTAFDVVLDWKVRIRYAFLSGFESKDRDDDGDIAWLIKAHFNTVQFYDWMYRHESLLPPEQEYTDPLGRTLSYPAVLDKIDRCKSSGITPLAYGAIYASSRSFWEVHKDWGLYSRNGQPMSFGGWLQFMNICTDSPWRKHILTEFSKTVREAGFMGIHMDTYGYPKNAYDSDGRPIDLSTEFPALIMEVKKCLRDYHTDTGVIFNCVGNWPVEAVARAPVDAVYIEVWPPCERYAHLVSLIRNGLILGECKPVILAAYMTPFKTAQTPDELSYAENALLLAYSVIHASGGVQLVFGENACVLCDPYYAEHKTLRPGFLPTLQRYLDHSVRMVELTDRKYVKDMTAEFTGGINTEVQFKGAICSPFPDADTVWTVIGQAKGKYVIQLINLTGLQHDYWNKPQRKPKAVSDLIVEALVDYNVNGVYSTSPDSNEGFLQILPYKARDTERGQAICFTVPQVIVWTTVWIEFEM